jgi:hypothetical protein
MGRQTRQRGDQHRILISYCNFFQKTIGISSSSNSAIFKPRYLSVIEEGELDIVQGE